VKNTRHHIQRSYYKPVFAQGSAAEDGPAWRIFRWLYLIALLLHPFYVPGLLWPFIWVLLGIQLVAVFRLNELPFLSFDWLAHRIRGYERGNEYEPGWYGYKGRTLRGKVDADGTLWFPLHDLDLPEVATRLIKRYGPTEIQRAGLTTWLSLDGLQRCLSEYPSTELRAMQRWLDTVVVPTHRRLLEKD
jgi:hypothetical protein